MPNDLRIDADLYFQLRNRTHRAQGDDEASILKGLPIHQWRQTEQLVAPPTVPQQTSSKQQWSELPMPRDSHLLPEVAQQLLRAARAGRLYQTTASTNDDEDKDHGLEEEEQKETPQGFYVRKWTQLPRHLEQPEPEHLAKRRKGLPIALGVGQIAPFAPPAALREIKVRKVDGEGIVSVYKMLIAEGQTVEGEIVQEDETLKSEPVEAAVAPGTVVEGLGVVNEQGVVVANDLLVHPTPTRRKPPPKRKPKKHGPGRGKKKVLFEPGVDSGAPDPSSSSLQVPGTLTSDGVPTSTVPSIQGDTPMPDAQEGDEDESSGSEGSEDGDEDREEGELSPTPEPDTS